MEPIHFGACSCGAGTDHRGAVQLFRSGQCANCHITELEGVLVNVAEFLEGKSDLVDGSYGEPCPNRAMQLLAELQRFMPPS